MRRGCPKTPKWMFLRLRNTFSFPPGHAATMRGNPPIERAPDPIHHWIMPSRTLGHPPVRLFWLPTFDNPCFRCRSAPCSAVWRQHCQSSRKVTVFWYTAGWQAPQCGDGMLRVNWNGYECDESDGIGGAKAPLLTHMPGILSAGFMSSKRSGLARN